MTVKSVIDELNIENGSNYKIAVLKNHLNNELLHKVLKMTYDKVKYNYGATLATVNKFTGIVHDHLISLDVALDYIHDNICTRKLTGHAGSQYLADILTQVNDDDRFVLEHMIERKLPIGIGRTQINKVFKGLITKPAYMRCGVYNEKTRAKISHDILQLKADGTYREFNKLNDTVTTRSRSGEEYDYPILNETLKTFKDGIYHGELTIILTDELLEILTPQIQKIDKKNKTNILEEITKEFEEFKALKKEYILPRSTGNGLLKSDAVPHENIRLELWDYITHDEYDNAVNRKVNVVTYKERFYSLKDIIEDKVLESAKNMIRLIPYILVENHEQVMKQVVIWMKLGYEGGVLKDWSMVFKDGTSELQLKIKLVISIEVRCKGFKNGSTGKNKGLLTSIIFENDEGTIKGSCGGLSQSMLDQIRANPESFLEKVFEIECNDLTKGRNNDYYALSHPRLSEWRDDKDETDTLERALELKAMAMMLK